MYYFSAPCLSFPLPRIALTWTAAPFPCARPPLPLVQAAMPSPGTTGAHSPAPTPHPLADSPPPSSVSTYPPHPHDSASLLRAARASEDSQSPASSTNHARDTDRAGKQRAEGSVARDAAVAQNGKAKEAAALAKWRVSRDRDPHVV